MSTDCTLTTTESTSPIDTLPPEVLAKIFLIRTMDCRRAYCREGCASWSECTHSPTHPPRWYNTLDPTVAPKVFGSVSKVWRTVSQDASELWDTICFAGHITPSPASLQGVLRHSATRFLTIDIRLPPADVYWTLPPGLLAVFTERVVKLKVINLSADDLAMVVPAGVPLPNLRIIQANDADMPSITNLITRTASLEVLSISSEFLNRRSSFQLPWLQLKTLELRMVLTPDEAADILEQCINLESCKLQLRGKPDLNVLGVQVQAPVRPHATHTLLRDLSVKIQHDQPLEFLRSFSFSNLKMLEVSGGTFGCGVLPDLSVSQLTHLTRV